MRAYESTNYLPRPHNRTTHRFTLTLLYQLDSASDIVDWLCSYITTAYSPLIIITETQTHRSEAVFDAAAVSANASAQATAFGASTVLRSFAGVIYMRVPYNVLTFARWALVLLAQYKCIYGQSIQMQMY